MALSPSRVSCAVACVLLLSSALLLGCSENWPGTPDNRLEGPPEPEPDPYACRGSGCPPSCPDILCVDTDFGISLQRADPWPLAAYYFRVGINGRQPRTCKVEFQPVVGEVVDTCNTDDFGVGYEYTSERPLLFGLAFSRSVHHVDMELLMSEEGPPLATVQHDVVYITGTLGEPPCSQSCTGAEVLVVAVDSQIEIPSRESPADGGFPAEHDAGLDADL